MIETTTVRPASHEGYHVKNSIAFCRRHPGDAGCYAASAKTLVFCSEGSPENFYPGVNTTGTSFDANEPIYNRLVEFERGSTKVMPGLAEKWDDLAGRHRLHLPPAQGREVALDIEVVQADARLQCRRRHLLVRAAVEGRQSVFQGDEPEPFLFQRHGHAEAAEVGREGRRLHRQVHAEPAGSAVPRQPRDGLRRRSSRRNMPTPC